MKLDLAVDKIKEVIEDSTGGQKTSYRMLLKGGNIENDYQAVIVGPEPFTGFTPGLRVSLTIANPQSTLG